MIKVTGRDNGKGVWMDVVGITTRGRQEVARIPRSTLSRIIKVKDGEMGCISVDVLRDIGVNAGFYRLDKGVGMWVEPREMGIEVPHEEDSPNLYGARLIEMYYKSGVRVDMRALRGVLDVASIIGVERCHLMAKDGSWMLVDTETGYVAVKERDDALATAYNALEMDAVCFNVADVEQVWEDVVATPFDAPEWDINGQGRLCLWIGETGGARLADVSGGGEIAYSVAASDNTTWKESVAAIHGKMFWNAKPAADETFRAGVCELGLHLSDDE